jgi:single-stranded-DNA-specific exonuclease
VPELRDRLQQHATIRLTPQILERKLDCSAELPLHRIDTSFYQALRLLEPYGMGNEEPVFIARGVVLDGPPQIMKDEHIRMRVRDGETVMKALGWRWAERVRALSLDVGSRIDLAYRLRVNEHPDFGGLELEIVDLRPA